MAARRMCLSFVSLFCLAALAIGLRAGDDAVPATGFQAKDDPAGRAVFNGMLEKLKQAKTLAYTTAHKWASGDRVISESAYRVLLKKPGLARVEGRRGDLLAGVFVGDGEQAWMHWPAGRPFFSNEDPKLHEATKHKTYMREDFRADKFSISHRAPRLGAGSGMLIFQPTYFFGYLESLHPLIDGIAHAGTEKIGTEECDMIDVSYARGQRTRRLWVARGDKLPRRVTETIKVKTSITAEERWSDIALDGELADDLFKWTPPADWKEWRMPGIEAGLLQRGAVAPDFSFPGADGKPIRLSEHRGKVVWLAFWRAGCPPCRVELKKLQEAHEKLASQGLVVLGYNCADDPRVAKDLLAADKVSFPCVLDSSDAATAIFISGYQRPGLSAVPLNYLIDREGKVAAAWYGYEKADQRPFQELAKLGIK